MSGIPSIASSKGAPCRLLLGTCFYSLSLASSVLPTAASKSLRDPSGVKFKDGSNLISSCLGVTGVRCLLIDVYCHGTSSPGSPLIHSLHFNDGTSSNAAKLGVIPKVTYDIEFCILTHIFPSRVYKTFLFLCIPLMIQHPCILHANSYISHPISNRFYPFSFV